MNRNGLIVAIDGPSASGKSTTARLVAARLGYTYIDTGAMYRAVTLAALRNDIDPADAPTVEKLASFLTIRFHRRDDGSLRTMLEGVDVSEDIRAPHVTSHVSQISSYQGVREAMVSLQREMSNEGGVVLDGRDIGTVVFPNADVKVFMVADINSRARRRGEELASRGGEAAVETVAADLRRRDTLDSSRELSPLKKAEDAVEIDTTELTIEGQVERVMELVRAAEGSAVETGE